MHTKVCLLRILEATPGVGQSSGAIFAIRGFVPFPQAQEDGWRQYEFRRRKNGSLFCDGKGPQVIIPNRQRFPVQKKEPFAEAAFTQ